VPSKKLKYYNESSNKRKTKIKHHPNKAKVLTPIMKLIRESCKLCLMPPEGKNFNIFQELKSSVLFASENSVVSFLLENPRCRKPNQKHEVLPPFCIT